jgi:DNA repair exonuclease SbcCD nuclease subunit
MADVLLVNDIHLSDRPPSSCTDSYLDDLFGLLDETATLALDRRIAAVVWAGDVFHHKTPGRTSHGTVMRAIETAESYPCPLYIVPGNHDLTHDRLSSLDETQPLGVLLRSGHAHLLAGWDALDINLPLYGVPWLQHWNDDTVSDALRAYRRHGDAHSLVVTHAPLYPPGHELKYEFYPAGEFAAAMGHTGSVHYGHVHEPHGIYHAEGVTFSNPGALSRGSLHEHNLTRDVQIAIWNTGTAQFTHHPLPAKPAAEVFRLQEITEVRTAQHVLDEFLTSVGQTRIEITSIEAITHHIRGLDLDADLTDVLLAVLDKAGRA